AAAGLVGGCHDRGLDTAALRAACPHLEPHHQRGGRREPGRARRDVEAAGHDRMGVSPANSASRSRSFRGADVPLWWIQATPPEGDDMGDTIIIRGGLVPDS